MPATILLVAGPSGAGKSTFIQCLKAGKLPGELRHLLPPSACRWRTFEANDLLKRDLAPESVIAEAASEEGLVLHFDIAFGRRRGVMDYFDDPLMDLIREPAHLVVVSIHPTPATLRAQFEARLQQLRAQRGVARELWRRAVHRPLRLLLRRARGQRTVDTSTIYARPSELQQCYREWLAFARALISRARDGRLICVEPVVGLDGAPSYAIIADPAEALSRLA